LNLDRAALHAILHGNAERIIDRALAQRAGGAPSGPGERTHGEIGSA
jgi:hypothetical protein